MILTPAFPAPAMVVINSWNSRLAMMVTAVILRRTTQSETMKKMAKKVKKHRSQKPNTGTEHLEKPNSRLSSQHKLEMARRRSRVAELASEGQSVRAAEEILRWEGFEHCSHVTVAADLKLERDRLAAATRATTVLHRQKVLEELTQLREFVRARGWDDPNYVADLLSIVDRVIRLMGLAEQHHHVSVVAASDDIPAEKLIGWKRWLRETRDVPEDSFDAIWAVCRKLSQPSSFESAMLIGPPEDSPLWHDEDEDEGKSN